jgi:chorismate-pyruvate lyase
MAMLLDARLRASDSATGVIGELFGNPVRIERVPCEPIPLDATQEAELAPNGDAVLHRRVKLVAGGAAVSEADLWYVPSRLWPGMAEQLRDTTVPFGTIVRPMRPRRHVLASRAGGPWMLEHDAVLHDRSGRPIALVAERYLWRKEGQGSVLDPLGPEAPYPHFV